MLDKSKELCILIIDNDFTETSEIKMWLEQDMRVPWNYMHCISVREAVSRINSADLVILKPEMEGLASPMQVFKDIGDMAFEIPIIVLTSAAHDEHGLSTYVMEKGAADTVIRGKFERLVDAIEFSLIRQKITTGARKAQDQTLIDQKEKATEELQNSFDLRAEDHDAAEEKLNDSQKLRMKDQEESKTMLSMLMGGYSVTGNDNKK